MYDSYLANISHD